jgi:anti-sigma factor RsiW
MTPDRAQLIRLMDGSLDDATARRLRSRLEHDTDLRAEWNRLQAMQSMLQAHTASFEDGFSRRVMQRLRPAPGADESLAEALQWLFVRVEVAALALIVLLAVYNVTAMNDAVAASSFLEALFGLPGTTLENVLLFAAL